MDHPSDDDDLLDIPELGMESPSGDEGEPAEDVFVPRSPPQRPMQAPQGPPSARPARGPAPSGPAQNISSVQSSPQMASPQRSPATADKKIVNLTSDIPVQIVAVLGKRSVSVKDIVSMRMGQVLELNRMPNEAIDLVVNGKLIAKGELVEIDGRLGVRILKVFE